MYKLNYEFFALTRRMTNVVYLLRQNEQSTGINCSKFFGSIGVYATAGVCVFVVHLPTSRRWRNCNGPVIENTMDDGDPWITAAGGRGGVRARRMNGVSRRRVPQEPSLIRRRRRGRRPRDDGRTGRERRDCGLWTGRARAQRAFRSSGDRSYTAGGCACTAYLYAAAASFFRSFFAHAVPTPLCRCWRCLAAVCRILRRHRRRRFIHVLRRYHRPLRAISCPTRGHRFPSCTQNNMNAYEISKTLILPLQRLNLRLNFVRRTLIYACIMYIRSDIYKKTIAKLLSRRSV